MIVFKNEQKVSIAVLPSLKDVHGLNTISIGHIVTPSPNRGRNPRGDANSIDRRAEDTTRRARRPERAVIRLRARRAVFSRIRKFGLNTLIRGWSVVSVDFGEFEGGV